MAKKSRKRPARPKKDNAGCMSGLISMFDFRQGRFTQKLLPDRKHGSGRHGGSVHSKNKFDVLSNLEENHQDVSDTNIKEVERDNSVKASIKALMAEEMSRGRTSKRIPSSRVEQLRAELGFRDNLDKDYTRRPDQNYKVGVDHDVSDVRASQSTWSEPSESSSFDVNLAELMLEFCREGHECQENHIESNGERKITCLSEPNAQLTQRHYILQKALMDITDALHLTPSSDDPKQVGGHRAVQPEEFMDALETLNSNRDIFLKLLQDPNSLLFKHIPDLQTAYTREFVHGSKPEGSVSCQTSHKQNKHHFFKKKDKSDGAKISNEGSSQALKRIVVLKPSPARYEHCSNTSSPISSPRAHNLQHHEGTERASSNFSLKEIKRRLRNMVGDSKRGRDLITMDGVLHKIPYGHQNSDDINIKTLNSTKQTSKLAAFLNEGENIANLKQLQLQKKVSKPTVGDPLYRETAFYEEARKRLIEMLSSDSLSGASSPRQVSKSLGRILSLPGYSSSSPIFSPGRDKEIDLPVRMGPSPLQKSKQDDSTIGGSSIQGTESLPCSDENLEDGREAINSNQTLHEPQSNIGEELIQKESTVTEVRESLDVPVEFSTDELGCNTERCISMDELGCNTERCIEEGTTLISDSVSLVDVQPLTPSVSIRPNSIVAKNLEDPESNTENIDRPSPVSVLEPFFSEDVNSPEGTKTDKVELTAEPQQLTFEECSNSPLVLTSRISEANLTMCLEDKEPKLKYVRTVLEASDLNYNKLPERWQSLDQLLDPFVFDEVEIMYDQLIDDSKLLFDCINEVLVEIRDRFMICSPWMSSIRPNIRPNPTGENFVREVCKGVSRHLQTVSPYTLDRVVRNDLEGETWMNIRLEMEGSAFEIGEVILEYIMEETILELWD